MLSLNWNYICDRAKVAGSSCCCFFCVRVARFVTLGSSSAEEQGHSSSNHVQQLIYFTIIQYITEQGWNRLVSGQSRRPELQG